MRLGTGGRLLAAAAAAVHLRDVQAQIYSFESVQVPEAKTLQTLYTFYVYSHNEAPEKKGQPFVKFHGLTAIGAQESSKSVEVSLVPFTRFWDMVNPDHFCGDAQDALDKQDRLVLKGPGGDGLISQPARSLGGQDVQVPVRETDIYVLMVSNCGDASGVKLSGNVIVKNSYGFLPGVEYHKLPFYGWLSLLYGALAVAWLAKTLQHWREVLAIQNCIAVVIGLGMVESCLWWIFYNDWNVSGTRGKPVFVMALFVSVSKNTLSYMLVLVASLGWGVTRPYLDHRTVLKIQGVSVLYIILAFIRDAIMSFRHSHNLSAPFVMLCLMPVSVMHGGIFYWIFSSLSSLIDTLKQRRQLAKLEVFQKLWWVLTMVMVIAATTLLTNVFAISRTIMQRWKYQWFLSDGAPHMLFFGVLVVIMYLWRPTQDSKQFAYTPADNKEREGEVEVAGMWADEKGDVDDEDEDESFWATTRSGGQAAAVPATGLAKTSPTPDVVGTTERDV